MTQKDIEDIRNRIMTGLTISRVPRNTKKRFLEIANEDDFCKDYGMAFKYLVDFHDGIIIDPSEKITKVLQEQAISIAELKEDIRLMKEKPKKKRTTLGGKIIG